MDHIFLRYGVVALATLVAVLSRHCGGRDLRPSDHGLSYQEDSSPPPEDARSFFGASVELPEAKNISDATWWSAPADGGGGGGGGGGGSRDAGRDHVRVGMLVASGVCGLTGVVLMVVSGVVFVFRVHGRKTNVKGGGIESTSAPISGV